MKDLRQHRAAVEETIARMDQFAIGMEHFAARGSGDATTIALEELAHCDIYILILAWRYGFIPDGHVHSITHLEYKEARRLHRPIFIFLADPSTEEGPGATGLFPTITRDWPAHEQLLRAFRAEVMDGNRHVVDFFTDSGDLAAKVATALYRYLRDVRRVPRNIPPRIPDFVGRADELATLCAELLSGQSVGLSAAVAGMAGVGKSALAAETLRALASNGGAFPGGITWVRCDSREGLGGLTWVYDQLLADWNIYLRPEQDSLPQTPDAEVESREHALRAHLRAFGAEAGSAPALVLLDNVEVTFPLDRALQCLAPLGVTLLVTARHDVEVQGFRLKSLDVLALPDAVRLFKDRFVERGGQWDDALDSKPAAAIVEKLGCLPLAIELAAARVARTKMSIADLSDEMERPVNLDKFTDVPNGTRSVRYAFTKSLAQLTPSVQARFAALGLPDGPDWPRDLIQRLLRVVHVVRGGTSLASDRDADDLDVLAAFSLVTLVPGERSKTEGSQADHGIIGRVRLHPLLRIHARDEWNKLPYSIRSVGLSSLLSEVHTLVKRHQHDYAALAREEDLIAGAVQRAAWEQVEPSLMCKIIFELTDYLNLGGHWRLGAELFKLKLDAEQRAGDRLGEGTTLNNLGRLAEALGDLNGAARYYEQALVIRREEHDRVGEGVTLNNLGNLSLTREHMQEASYYLETALTIRREEHDRLGEGTTLNNLGRLAEALGDLNGAARYYEQALVIRREEHDRVGEGVTLNNLGRLAEARGKLEQAAEYYEQALVLRQGVDRLGEGTTLNNLGRLAEARGKLEQAAEYYEQALSIFRSIGAKDLTASALRHLAELKSQLNQVTAFRTRQES